MRIRDSFIPTHDVLKKAFVILNIVKDLPAVLLRPVFLQIDPSFLRITNFLDVNFSFRAPGF
jgi:hypothetical protein